MQPGTAASSSSTAAWRSLRTQVRSGKSGSCLLHGTLGCLRLLVGVASATWLSQLQGIGYELGGAHLPASSRCIVLSHGLRRQLLCWHRGTRTASGGQLPGLRRRHCDAATRELRQHRVHQAVHRLWRLQGGSTFSRNADASSSSTFITAPGPLKSRHVAVKRSAAPSGPSIVDVNHTQARANVSPPADMDSQGVGSDIVG